MTTLDNPTISQFLVFKLGKAITNRKEAKAKSNTYAGTWVIQLVRLVLHLSGFGCLTYAGFTVNMTAGLIVAGLSFFVLSNLSTSKPAQQPQTSRDPMADRRTR